MKFLHISDLHIGKRVNEFSMIEDQKYIYGRSKRSHWKNRWMRL